MSKRLKLILVPFLILGSLYFLFIGLSRGKAFLIPLTTAIILSMVMSPVAKKLTGWGVARGLAVFLADLVVVLFIAFMIFLLVAQGNKVADNWSQIESRLKPKIEQVQQFLNDRLNIPTPELKEMIESGSQQKNGSLQNQNQQQDQNQNQQQNNQGQNQQQDQNQQQGQGQGQGRQPGNQDQSNQQQSSQQQDSENQQASQGRQEGQQGSSGSGKLPGLSNFQGAFTSIVSNVFGFLADMLLILVYIFFFMYYQKKFEDSIVGFAEEDKKEEVRNVIHEASEIAQQYLFGRFILIFILAALYLLGYSIIGLQYALFISLIAALFSLLPYVGNVLGLFLAVGMSFLGGGGGSGQLIGIVVIFSVVQFVESYILEPYVVGGKVDLNPVMVIVGVVLGGIVWGIMGMILAIPILGILKVVCDHVGPLKPLAYMLDERGISSGENAFSKVKKWVEKKVKG